jgi:hypothetical protein
MDVFKVRPDNTEELLASGLSSHEIYELREWFSYTKPLGSDMKVVARQTSKGTPAFSVHAAGNEAESQRKPSEID